MTLKTLSVRCPTCKTEVLMTADSPYRPFCSQRCKTIDFGDWACENHRIPGASADEQEGTEMWSDDGHSG